MAVQSARKMPAAETSTSGAGRRRKRRVTNWLHAADWRWEANRSSKVSDARDQRRCDISRSCEMPQRLLMKEDGEERRLSIRASRAARSTIFVDLLLAQPGWMFAARPLCED